MSDTVRRFPFLTVTVCLAAMCGVAWLGFLAYPSIAVVTQGDRIEHTYYIPSKSMQPTLDLDDRIMPLRIGKRGIERGQVIVFEAPVGIRIARVAAVGGDTIELRNGVVTLNGQSVPQRSLGPGPPNEEGNTTRLIAEQFPGERHAHRIMDMGVGAADDVAPFKVASGSVYVLGDNRDRAADSRIPIYSGGVGQIPTSRALGSVDTVYWARNRARIGLPIDPVDSTGKAPR